MLNTNYGWIEDENHPIVPKPNKKTFIDIAVGLITMIIGAGYIAITSFHHGAHAYEESELNVMNDLNLLHQSPDISVSEDIKNEKW